MNQHKDVLVGVDHISLMDLQLHDSLSCFLSVTVVGWKCFCFFLLLSNSCTCPASSAWPSWASRGVSYTGPTAPSAAWPETRTAPGTDRPAPGSSPPARGNEHGGRTQEGRWLYPKNELVPGFRCVSV